jgi:hypothetical protein
MPVIAQELHIEPIMQRRVLALCELQDVADRRAKAIVIGSREQKAAVFQFSFVSLRKSDAASPKHVEPQFSVISIGCAAHLQDDAAAKVEAALVG